MTHQTTGTKPLKTSSVRIVLGSSFLAKYPEGGGVWTCVFQYLFALRALGHDVFWIEVLHPAGDSGRDAAHIRRFFEQFRKQGFGGRCALLVVPPGSESQLPDATQTFGHTLGEVQSVARSSDIVWNFAGGLTPPILDLFTRRAHIDIDPGMIQIAALTKDMRIEKHDVLFTVGANVHSKDCDVPTLGRSWNTFLPSIELPRWPMTPIPPRSAPFSSITQWTWGGEYHYQSRVLSTSKRDAYLRYVELPRLARRPFQLAANIGDYDVADDRARLSANGWSVVDPHVVAGTMEDYANYIRASYAELSCPKPIYRELKTGWLSDRSACYLAAGRPVLAEDTGLSGIVPTDRGFVTFRNLDEALTGVEAIDSNYEIHRTAARAFAEQFLDARKNVTRMLEVCLRTSEQPRT